jgi:glycosyltransferase involved in cell wall biosynthesis
MRIGIFPNFSKNFDGGHHYQLSVIDAVCSKHNKSKEEFVIFNVPEVLKERWKDSNNVKFGEYNQFIYSNYYFRAVMVCFSKVPFLFNFLKGFDVYAQIKQKYNLDMFLFLTPNKFHSFLPVPFIFPVWDLEYLQKLGFPEVSANGQWEERHALYSTFIPRAFAVLVPSEIIKKQVEHFFNVVPSKVKVLPLLPTKFLETNRDIFEAYGIPKDFFFYPAQYWPHKNHANILRALAYLKDEKKVVYNIVFSGKDNGNLKFLKNLARKLGIDSQVHFLGYIKEGDMAEVYRNSKALVMPSFLNPNIPPLEAMYYNCPVITTNSPEAKEQLGSSALFVDPLDFKSIAIAMYNVDKEPNLRNQMIRKGMQQIKKFGVPAFVKVLNGIFNEFRSVRKTFSDDE